VRVTRTGNADEPEFGRHDDRDPLDPALDTDHFHAIRLRAGCKVVRGGRLSINQRMMRSLDFVLANIPNFNSYSN
jgi:hypothetical protein